MTYTLLHGRSGRVAPLPALCLLLALPAGCDDPSNDAAEEATSTGDEGDTEPTTGQDAVDGHGMDALSEESRSTAALPNYQRYDFLPPIRAEDLKPGYVAMISPASGGVWDDLNIVRWDGGWQGQEPGLSGEQGGSDWDVPVYSGVDGEIIACWRDSPYEPVWEDFEDIHPVGGNYVIIKTDEDYYVYYAHLTTSSIPSALCPNHSVSGFMTDRTDLTRCPIGGGVCSNIPEEAYVWPNERAEVKAGQYIGRIGAHGNAAGAHLHMGVGTVSTGAEGVLSTIDSPPRHMTFTRSWWKPQSGATDETAWALADDTTSKTDLLEDVDAGYTLVWPSWKAQATYSADYRMADYSGNGADDLLCHDTASGSIYVDYAASGQLGGTDWTGGSWCDDDTQRLYNGDFDGNGRDDLLCHDIDTGDLWVDLADAQSRFLGTDFTTGDSWCHDDTQQLKIGDFNGDGEDDLLCHDHASGQMWIDYAAAGTIFAGTDTSIANGWCYGRHQRLHVGKFDYNASQDLLCHDVRSGGIYIDHASSGTFGGTDTTAGTWCNGGGQRLYVANVDGGTYDELVCHDGDDGMVYVDWASYGGTDWSGDDDGWCTGPYERLRFGDVDDDGRDDLVCHDQMTGQRWIDYAAPHTDPGGIFDGIDWTSGSGNVWCHDAVQALH